MDIMENRVEPLPVQLKYVFGSSTLLEKFFFIFLTNHLAGREEARLKTETRIFHRRHI